MFTAQSCGSLIDVKNGNNFEVCFSHDHNVISPNETVVFLQELTFTCLCLVDANAADMACLITCCRVVWLVHRPIRAWTCWGQGLCSVLTPIFCLYWRVFSFPLGFRILSRSLQKVPKGVSFCFIVSQSEIWRCVLLLCSQELTLAENSRVFEAWKNPPPPVYMEYYFFNVTNPEVFLAGGKAAVQQIGPYTYR